ncbi:MAG TPA: serine/threonine-protein kinase [Acidimicrobiales bacterium]|nr:serine/threonine-protein kinase [Acidimicrobiales bacterium]
MGTSVTGRLLNGRYRLGPLVGRGGMADVRQAHDELLDRPVAVKMLRADMAVDPSVRTRFGGEARCAARLHHPNVVSVFDTGEDGGEPYLVMEMLHGDSLAERMAGGPVDPDWLRVVAAEVLAALGAAHQAGLVHRDVKPANVLFTSEGQAKVADFGIAKSAEPLSGDVTSTGLLLGTPAYLAPERIAGHPATPRSDLYSLGVVLYEALTGLKPFSGGTAMEVATAIATSPTPPLDLARPGLDPLLVAAVGRAMAKDPLQRPATAAEMAGDLGLVEPPSLTTAAGNPASVAGAVAAVADPTLVSPSPSPVSSSAMGAQDLPRRAIATARPIWRRRAPVLLMAATVVLFVLLVTVAGRGGSGGGDGRDALARELSALADRVEVGDGVQGPAAAERLREVADQVEAGGGGDAATELLRDATTWNRSGQLFDTAYAEMVDVLRRVPGVNPAVLTTTTTAPAVTVAPAPGPGAGGGDDDGGGNGKGRKRDKD